MAPSKPGVVIVGCPRSGTSLVASLMESRLGLAAPVEPHFIEYFAAFQAFLPQRLSPRQRRFLVNVIFEFLLIWVPRNNKTRSFADVIGASLLNEIGSREEIARAADNYAGILSAFFDVYAEGKGKMGWIDKSAYYDPPHLERISSVLPSAKFIHIVRDGRDVAVSWRDSWFSPPDMEETARLWRTHVASALAWGERNRDRCHYLSYERLTQDPEGEIGKIAEFLDLPLRQEAVSDLAKVLARGGTHDLISKGVYANSNKWKGRLQPHEVETFETIAGEMLEQCGYVRATAPSSARRCLIGLRQKYRRMMAPLHGTVMARKSKRLIPVAAALLMLVGIRLSGMLAGRWKTEIHRLQQQGREGL